jgi:renalase
LGDDTRIAIIGSGMAGIACARRLAAAGLRPSVFDKGRRAGGRLATRRTADGLQFDHGAQYLTAQDGAFGALLEAAAMAGAVGRWTGAADRPRYVGVPAMQALAEHLSSGLDLRQGQTVDAVLREGAQWTVCVDGERLHFARVVLTVPAPQLAGLLGPAHPFVAATRDVRMAPCLTLMAALSDDTPAPFLSRSDDDDPLAWIALDASKPGRPAGRAWVAQANEAFSEQHLELPPASMAALMLPLLCARLGAAPSDVHHAVAHRWRYARVTRPLGQPFLRDPTGSLHAGGDWCLAARVEAAWQSGDAIARDILDGL